MAAVTAQGAMSNESLGSLNIIKMKIIRIKTNDLKHEFQLYNDKSELLAEGSRHEVLFALLRARQGMALPRRLELASIIYQLNFASYA